MKKNLTQINVSFKSITLSIFMIMLCSIYAKAQVSAYTFSQASGAYYEVPGDSIVQAASGTAPDNANFASRSIGFSFTYNGVAYTKIGISSNGYIWFGTGLPSTTNFTPISTTTNLGGSGTINGVVSAMGKDVRPRTTAPQGTIVIDTAGVTGSHICTVQFKNFRGAGGTGTAVLYNFQIKLYEGTNTIKIVYGTQTMTGATAVPCQVGLRGADNTDFNNRTTATDWTATTAGATNNATMATSATIFADSGRTYIWNVPPPCVNPATAGAAAVSNDTICSGTSVNLSLTGTSTGTGLTYQWQSSPNNTTFTDIASATTTGYAVSPTVDTYYRCNVTCSGGTTVSSTSILVHVNSFNQCYCLPASTNTTCANGGYIDSVAFNTLSNSSVCTAVNGTAFTIYAPAGSTTTSVAQGSSYALSVRTSAADMVGVWIDYDHSGTFDATEYTQVSAATTANVAASINVAIPSTALLGATGMRIRSRGNGGTFTSANPCTSFGSGEAEDYTITITAGAACINPATAGAATVSNDTICTGTSVNLALTGTSTGTGLTYQWQSSPNNTTFTDIATATAATYTVSPTADTYYRCNVTCGAGTTVSSTSIFVHVNPFNTCYCIPASTNTTCANGGYIDSVAINTLSNGSVCTAVNGTAYTIYAPAGSTTTSVAQGNTYSLNVRTSTAEMVGVWIDYDHSGTFDATEYTQVSAATTPNVIAAVNITIPNTSLLGATGMRIRSRGNAGTFTSANPCTSFGSGEAEDYTITITAPVACVNPAVAGTATVSNDTICGGTSVNLNLSATATGSGLTYQWQSSTNNITFSDIVGATTMAYAVSPSVSTYYQCNVTCSGGTTVASSAILVHVNPFFNCYCIPASTNTTCTNGGYIDSVAIATTTLNNTSACTAVNGTAYTIYPATGSTTATVNAGQAYTFEVRTTGTNSISAWIDYNHSGTFDNNEWTQIQDSSLAGIVNTAAVIIPANALAGLTGMRLRSRTQGAQNDSTSACAQFGSGEAEDYFITINVPIATDLALQTITAPAPGGCYGPNQTVSALIKNTGSQAINFATTPATVTANITGVNPANYTVTLSTGTLAPGATQNVIITTTYAMTQSGAYSFHLVVTIPGDGNAANNTFNATGNISLPVVSVSGATTLCGTGTANLTSTVSGGAGSNVYSWNNGAGTASTASVTPTQTTTYALTVTDANGCTAMDSATVTIATIPTADAGADVAICAGSSATLTASGGTSYAWLNGPVVASQTVSPTNTASYIVTVSDANCSANDTVIVTVNSLPVIDATNAVVSQTACGSSTGSVIGITATGTGTLSYDWTNANNASMGSGADLTGVAAGVYTLTVTDTACSASTMAYGVTNAGAPVAPLATSPAMYCLGDVIADLTATASAGGTITWYTDAGLTVMAGTGSPFTSGVTATTTYYVTETATGCESPYTAVTVTINDSIAVSSFTYDASGGLTIAFTSTSTDAATYAWDFGDGSSINNSMNPTHTYAANGLYDVTLTVTNACTNDTSIQTLDLLSVGIAKAEKVNTLNVYPNPTTDVLNVVMNNVKSSQLTMRMIDATGRIVFEEKMTATGNTVVKHLDLSTQAKGLYILQVISNNGIETRRVTVQ